jgi:hypothetical protein
MKDRKRMDWFDCARGIDLVNTRQSILGSNGRGQRLARKGNIDLKDRQDIHIYTRIISTAANDGSPTGLSSGQGGLVPSASCHYVSAYLRLFVTKTAVYLRTRKFG